MPSMATDSDKAPRPTLTMEQRRARRQERREKQRLTNAGRAVKMHAARLAAAINAAPGAKGDDLPAINVGCSSWFY